LVQSSILEATVELTSDKTLSLDNKSLFDAVPFFIPFVAPLGISTLPAKQRGKKHGKKIVKRRDGFVIVAYDSGPRQLVSSFTNRKDGRRLYQNGQ
jgi:hypothetical protein